MTEVLRITGLTKMYKDVCAVNNIDFSIIKGHCFGLLGRNGAGKTTTIELMEGIITPTQGQILYYGKPINKEFCHKIGIQFQHTALQDYLTVKETLQLFSALYQHPLKLEYLIELCHLEEFVHRDNRVLSGGQRQRLLLALAMVNNPEIIFLDEPTTGLDPQARRNFWQLIENIKAENKTVVLTTHYMDEAEQLCDDIVIMDRGEIIEEGQPDYLLNHHFEDVLIYLPESNVNAKLVAQQMWRITGHRVEIASKNVEQTLSFLMANNVSLHGLHVKSANLDDLFLKLTGHSLRE